MSDLLSPPEMNPEAPATPGGEGGTPPLARDVIAMDILWRTFFVIGGIHFIYRSYCIYRAHGDPQILGLLIGELLASFFLIFSRFTADVNRQWKMIACVLVTVWYWEYINLAPGQSLEAVLAPTHVAFIRGYISPAIMLAGVGLQILGKLALGRSFDIFPANRGIVVGGPYRFVRHPIYTGYFMMHVGFFMTRISVYNLCVLAACYMMVIYRIVAEEALLSKDPAYREYMEKTPSRAIPGIF